MTCIKMGSDESHFNVSSIVRDKVTRQYPQTTTFEEKGEPKRYRTEVLPLTSLCTALPLGQTGFPVSCDHASRLHLLAAPLKPGVSVVTLILSCIMCAAYLIFKFWKLRIAFLGEANADSHATQPST